ncbi:YidC/Oxa1 family membrane protein insertase [Dehalogenimonas formicexedens]|uniref:YidC/Oxa1 family membrane protein insertase n=1 Tax=Dehalogenimonas formicexedens TaxID=1839801 RepID=A0A1P8F7D9_9CHLR|nr:YidC/Oxa1 family membrane protein insertase [Dehalogenimonas formicexedens]APV44370.1 YidC/Oxa1 family membrane protein insertase [Dehalogenimonas formicexedens]
MSIGDIWNVIILDPLINGMVWLSSILFHNFGLTVIVLTAVIFGLMYPLTIKQMKAAKAMQVLQPKLQALQKKYAKDRQRLAQEQMALMRESGTSATGCLVPTLIQFPIWLALYQAIVRVLAVTPEDFLNLSGHLYNWQVVYNVLPLSSKFLWIDLANPDYVLALLVGVAMFIQQKMTTPPATDPKVAAQSQLMLFMMPAMFVFISITFPAGLALYWLTSSILRVVVQFAATGPGELKPWLQGIVARFGQKPSYQSRVTKAEKSPAQPAPKIVVEQAEEIVNEGSRSNRADGGGSNQPRPGQTKGQPGRGGDRRRKRR